MKKIRVVIEFEDAEAGMRWERSGADAFELLGRAFEVMQRETEAGLPPALQAFLRGAVLQKEDVVEALNKAGA